MRPTLLLCLVLAGCGSPDGRERVLLVTTTSVEASGILDALTDAYHGSQDRYRLVTTAVGSGAALEIGRRGDADLLLTHDPAGEARFARDGFALEQGAVMTNEFVIVGPEAGAADIRAERNAVAAFRRIAVTSSRFVSRGDDSGTHSKELELWRESGLEPWRTRPAWYVEAGTGMSETLQMASQLGAITLADRGSYLFLRGRLRLAPLLTGDPRLRNPYTYMVPRSTQNLDGARDFARWLTGEPGQRVIRAHGIAEFGESLFEPAATPNDPPAGTR